MHSKEAAIQLLADLKTLYTSLQEQQQNDVRRTLIEAADQTKIDE